MRNRTMMFACGAFLLAGMGAPVSAHVMLAEPAAKAGSDYVARFRVGHGCSGSPTIALRIEIPPGILGAIPQPKPGWLLEVDHVDGRVSAVTWKGGKLAADKPGEFAVTMRLANTPGRFAFPATQTCENAVVHWSDIAAPGNKTLLKNPAPLLNVQPASASGVMPGMDMQGMAMPDGHM